MYLASIHIENYKGINDLKVEFQKDINVIIGENGCYKTALIDSIRLLYNLSKQPRDILIPPVKNHRR
jgi:putative ATP-dependent endonuclease of the OLD family